MSALTALEGWRCAICAVAVSTGATSSRASPKTSSLGCGGATSAPSSLGEVGLSTWPGQVPSRRSAARRRDKNPDPAVFLLRFPPAATPEQAAPRPSVPASSGRVTPSNYISAAVAPATVAATLTHPSRSGHVGRSSDLPIRAATQKEVARISGDILSPVRHNHYLSSPPGEHHSSPEAPYGARQRYGAISIDLAHRIGTRGRAIGRRQKRGVQPNCRGSPCTTGHGRSWGRTPPTSRPHGRAPTTTTQQRLSREPGRGSRAGRNATPRYLGCPPPSELLPYFVAEKTTPPPTKIIDRPSRCAACLGHNVLR
jgi:hypothetical protein